jgi:hypothetical protein
VVGRRGLHILSAAKILALKTNLQIRAGNQKNKTNRGKQNPRRRSNVCS